MIWPNLSYTDSFWFLRKLSSDFLYITDNTSSFNPNNSQY
jgi:hypothetical protein